MTRMKVGRQEEMKDPLGFPWERNAVGIGPVRWYQTTGKCHDGS